MTLQSNLFIVVESPMDAQIIRSFLGKEMVRHLRFFAAAGRVALATVGRNLLVHEGGPVLLVMDSDTRNPQRVDEQKSMAFLAMRGVVPPGVSGLSDWVKVFAFVPEIEVIFFEAPESLAVILGKKVPEEKVQEGLLAPKATLTQILDKGKINYQTLVTHMSPQVASILASSRQAHALKAIIESMMTPSIPEASMGNVP